MIGTKPFFIKKNSTLPILKFPVTEWIMRKYGITADMLENCAVTFSLYDLDNDVYKIANKAGSLVINDDRPVYPEEELYTLTYKFSINDTSKAGNYEAEFKVDFLGDHCGKITLPVNEKIKVTIQDSITKTTVI